MKNITEEINISISYLSSKEALESIERDPYWPKWNSPWWHMSLLFELDLSHKIPKVVVEKMVNVLTNYYLPIFPIHKEDIPNGVNPCLKTACFCAVGNMYQILFSCGIDVDTKLSWMKKWFFKYQLPDGGYNCDENAYTKDTPKSSMLSTLPCLEAVLFSRSHELTNQEIELLNKGANYILKHKLFRKISNGEVIDKDWLEIRFPRFYEYDFLRGYYFLEKWRQKSNFSIPDELVDEVKMLVSKQMTSEGIKLKRYNLIDKRSYNPKENGIWVWGETSENELMKAISFDGCICEALTKKWNEVKPKLVKVKEAYITAYKNPIKLKQGETVTIEKRETNPDWLGWIFCKDTRNISGWVSEKYLQESNGNALVIKDYDATELDADINEYLEIYYEEFGWCWCKNKNGIKGWIPTQNLQIK